MVANKGFIAGSCLILAPVLQAISTFFWQADRQGISTGTLIVLSTPCWIVGLAYIFHDIEKRVPRYAAIAFPLAVYGCVGGASFGLQGMYEELFGVSHDHTVDLIGQHPAAAFITLWMGGPLFPMSLIALGAVLTRIKYVPLPTGALIVAGGIIFPLSRIPREATIAHMADLILLLPFTHLAVQTLRNTPARTTTPAAVRTEHS
ncbi:hypothetical protein [Actinomadura harenae]|uniref:DUF4386 domain-containing protein n=1 Tax=Actinomadura harenae TaxID=2483351 RepID=A0A3M2M202_9ACTN|nr:hypothetical protein [Actinomadura harenae]RMI42903.1 hypothetical protein EBO15_17890 [Actinomadura harenae]